MKLKSIATTTDDRLKKLNKYIDDMNFEDTKNYVDFGDYGTDAINIHIENKNDADSVKTSVKSLISKYWNNFESEIDFHRYDGNYFVEIRPKKDESGIWEFIVESMDDTLYFKFNTNFVVNL